MEPGPCIISGWLHKKKDHKALLSGSYNKRWFVLRDAALLYFETPDETPPPKGEILLSDCSAVQSIPGEPGCFLLSSETRIFKFRSEPEQQASEWVQLVGEALERQQRAPLMTCDTSTSPLKPARNVSLTRQPWLDDQGMLQVYQESHFNKPDLELLRQKYRSICDPELWLTKPKFYSTFRSSITRPCLCLDRLFECMDKDGDGLISPIEYLRSMEILTHGTSEQKATFGFDVYNIARDGVLNRTDMQQLTRSILETIQNSYTGDASLRIDQGNETLDELVHSMLDSVFADQQTLTLDGFKTVCSGHFAVLDDFIREHAQAGLTATEHSP